MTTRICLWITYSNYLGIYYNNSPLITHTSAPSCCCWNSYANFLSIAPPNNQSPAFKLTLCKIILSKITSTWYVIAIWECPHNKQFLFLIGFLESSVWTKIVNMEDQPYEILEHIFKELDNLETILNCYNTNLRWRQIVEKVFANST